MAEGWIKLHRALAHHALWLGEKFSRGQAWVDLLMLANHRPGYVRVRGLRVEIQRGQVGHSEVTLAARWQWSRDKVRRFMHELEQDSTITAKRDSKISIITVTNYDQYQDSSDADNTAGKTAKHTADRQQTRQQTDTNKNEKNEKKNTKGNTPLTPRRGECSYSASFEEFWSAYPLRKGKAAAYRAWKSVEKKHPGVKPPQIITAVKAQVEADTFRSPHDGQLYIPHPATWLNAGRWDDDVKSPGGGPGDPLAGLTLEQKFARARTPQ